MDRNQAKEFYPILQAFAEGKVIECRTKPSTIKGTDVPNEWTEMKEIEFWNNTEYRIKPEPKYRPFKDAKECCCQKFIGMIGDLENKLPKVIEFINIDNRKE